jgi:hypothetical protein
MRTASTGGQSQGLFWAPDNLVAACGRCNYGGGRRRAVDNSRRRMEYLERVIQEQDQRIQSSGSWSTKTTVPRRAAPQSTATGNLLTRSAVLASGDGRSRLGGDISLEGSRV